MYHGKHEKPVNGIKKYKKSGVLLASLVLILALTVGTTVAFLIDSTDIVTNRFSPTHVDISLDEHFDHQTKSRVQILNNGNVDVYIRATVACYWTDSQGVIVEPDDCSYSPDPLELGDGWVNYQNKGIYYYTKSVEPGVKTENLLKQPVTATISPQHSNYIFHMEVHAEAIQADGVTASGNKIVEAAWGVDPETLK